MSTYTVTRHNSTEIARLVNEAYAAREIILLNRYWVIVTQLPARQPANSFANGTIGVEVAAKTRGKTRTIWIKVGESLTVS